MTMRSTLWCALGAAFLTGPTSAQVALHTVHGLEDYAKFGAAVAGVGDVDQDGLPDFAVGAPHTDVGGMNAVGIVLVYSGKDSGVLRVYSGSVDADSFGFVLAGGADVDMDGVPDLGAFGGSGNNLSSVRVFSGATGAVIHKFVNPGSSDSNSFGWSMAMSNDCDGDGFSDVIVGAPYDNAAGTTYAAGRVWVYSGASGIPFLVIDGAPNAGGWFGISVDSAGDVDGDGLSDIVVGSPDENIGGAARVFSGMSGALLHAFYGKPGDQLGNSVSHAGDMNGDGRDDIVVGAPYADANGYNSGAVIVYSGLDGSEVVAFPGSGAESRFGYAVGAGFDFDGDGHGDVAGSHTFGGGSRILSGLGGNLLQSLGTGYAMPVAVGDMTGDGLPEFAVSGDPFVLGSPSKKGSVRVIRGMAGCTNGESAVDLNVDGIPDACQVCQPSLSSAGPGDLQLALCGDALTLPGSKASLGVSNGPPFLPLFLLASTVSTPAPALGTLIYPMPNPFVYTGLFDVAGKYRMELKGKTGIPTTVYLQAIAPWQPGPLEVSGAIQITIGL